MYEKDVGCVWICLVLRGLLEACMGSVIMVLFILKCKWRIALMPQWPEVNDFFSLPAHSFGSWIKYLLELPRSKYKKIAKVYFFSWRFNTLCILAQ